MYGICKGPLDSAIIEFGKLQVYFAEIVPSIFAESVDEGGEIKRRVVAYILIARIISSRYVEINNSLIDLLHLFKGSNKRSNILEGCASYNF